MSNGIEATDLLEKTETISDVIISPDLAHLTFPLIDKAAQHPDFSPPVCGSIKMQDAIGCTGDHHREHFKISSKIFGSPISLNESGKFTFKGCIFSLHDKRADSQVLRMRYSGSPVRVDFKCNTLAGAHLGELIQLLFELGLMVPESLEF